jgi:hypothetical protein
MREVVKSGGGGNGGSFSLLSVAFFDFFETVSLECSCQIKNYVGSKPTGPPNPTCQL